MTVMKPTALITGASSGLGYEFAKLFAANGYNLVLTARNEEKLHQIKEEFSHVDVILAPKDLSQPHAGEELYQQLLDQDVSINVLVNNAGFGLNGEFDKLSLKHQQEMIQVNMTALTDLTYCFLPEIKKHSNAGHLSGILNVASTAAFQPGPYMSVYYASKAYVLSLSEGIASELKGTNVQVTTLCPGATETDFFKVAKAENTKLTENTMNAGTVAKEGFEGFIRRQKIVIPGRMNAVGAVATKFLPRSLATNIAKKINGAQS